MDLDGGENASNLTPRHFLPRSSLSARKHWQKQQRPGHTGLSDFVCGPKLQCQRDINMDHIYSTGRY